MKKIFFILGFLLLNILLFSNYSYGSCDTFVETLKPSIQGCLETHRTGERNLAHSVADLTLCIKDKVKITPTDPKKTGYDALCVATVYLVCMNYCKQYNRVGGISMQQQQEKECENNYCGKVNPELIEQKQ